MQLTDYVKILRRRWWMVAISVTLCVAAAVLMSARQAPRYTSSTRLLVTSGASAGDVVAAGRATSYAQLIETAPGVAIAEDFTNVPIDAPTVTAVPSGPFIVISVEAGTPAGAQALAAAYQIALPVIVSKLEQNAQADLPKLTTVETAALPTAPTSPRPMRDGQVAAVIGLILGLALALLRETLDGRLRDSGEIEKLSAATVLGLVPREQSGEPLPARRHPRSGRAEAYRHVRANLEFSGADGMPCSVAITSPGPGEGKSTLAANLAVVAAQSGRGVVIVDADLRKPSLTSYFNLTPGPGLSEVLSGQVTLDQALVPLHEERISVLQSGRLPALPGELVGSTVMVDLIEELEQRFDLVILDTPPVLPVSDALLIGVNVGGVVVVARMVETSRAALKKAVHSLRNVNAPLLGIVGNAVVKREERASGTGYGYGYGYGQKKDAETAGPVNLAPAGRRGQDRSRPAGRAQGRRAKTPADEVTVPTAESPSHIWLRQRIQLAGAPLADSAQPGWPVGSPVRAAVNGHQPGMEPHPVNGHQLNGGPLPPGTRQPGRPDDVFPDPRKSW